MKKRTTKHALFASALSLLLCISMLVGSTFAWFTDTASTSVNSIQAGKLDVDLVDENGNSLDGKTLSFVDLDDSAKAPENILWEPGAAWKLQNVTLVNKGNLKLKYQVVISAVNGNTTGNGANLADVIDVYFGETVENGALQGTLAQVLANGGLINQGAMEPGAKTTYGTIILKMQESADNKYQSLSLNNIAVTVYATQLGGEMPGILADGSNGTVSGENDSFGNIYDEDSNYYYIDDVAMTATINSPFGLYQFAQDVNGGNRFAGYTVTLDADIDMTGVPYVPAGNVKDYPGISFAGTFDGQGHTIRNLTVSDSTSNFASAGLFGSITGSGIVQNVILDHATITSTHYAGGIVGYCSETGAQINGCTVKNSKITSTVERMSDGKYDNGDKVGGIIGYMAAGATVTGCTVESTTISAYRDLGSIAGYSAGTVSNNAAKDVVLVIDMEEAHNYKNYATEAQHDLGQIVGENLGSMENNTINNVTESKKYVITSAEELKNILTMAGAANANNSVIELTADVKLNEAWTPVNVDGYHGADVITLNGNGHTISGLTAPLFAGGFAGGSGVVINDLTIEDSAIVSTNDLGSGAFIETVDSMDVITLNNCHVKNSSITGSRTGGLIGWNSGYDNTNDGAVKTYVTITNCTVEGCTITGAGTVGGIVGHAGANAWTWNTITNCTVKNCTLTSNDDSYRVGAIVGTANVGEVTISGCTSTGNTIKQNNSGTEIARPEGQSELYGRFVPGTTGKLTIDGAAVN